MEFTQNFSHQYGRLLSAAALTVIFTLGLCLVTTGLLQPKVSGQNLLITSVTSIATQNTMPSKAVTASHSSAKIGAQSSAMPRCTPVNLNVPPSLSLDDAPEGLSVQTEQPTLYRIYGNTAVQLRNQLIQCGPSPTEKSDSEFTGQADYNLNWQYDLTASNNVCTISNIKVGLHTSVALPYWQPTDNSTSGLASRWWQFMKGLQTHEDGHVTIDKTYAAKLLTDLQALNAMPCDQVPAAVNVVTSTDTADLNQANDAYDSRTNHGATQGAILPTY